MSGWRPYQMVRLAQERKLLALHMPDFDIREPTGSTHVQGGWVSNKGNRYVVRIDVPDGYPDECPDTYIEEPRPLLDHHGLPMTRYGASHDYHTWPSKRQGAVQICTYRAEYWNSSGTLIQLIHKAFLWITAYEAHRDSGRKIKELLLDM